MSRARKRIAFCGGTEKGKSSRIKEMIYHRCKKYNEPLIVLDPNRQQAWFELAEIDLEKLKKLKQGRPSMYRVNTDEYEEFFQIIFDNYKGGQIVAEESGNYLTPHKNQVLYKNLTSLRHPDHDVDITFVFHAVQDIPDYMRNQLNEIILLKTGDTWDKCQGKVPDHAKEIFQEAFTRVNKHESNFYWERIVLQKTGVI